MPDFIGAHTWEEVCREWVLRASNRGVLPLYPDDVQSAWAKGVNIDVVGVNTMRRHLILGECKWTRGPMDLNTLKGLVDKANLAVPNESDEQLKASKGSSEEEDWQVYFLGFSKSGFTHAAEEFARQIANARPAGSRWIIAGCLLVDLPRIDRDLADWAS
jgi:hypothetical protein